MKIKLYLDIRKTKKGQPAPLKIAFSHKGKSALLSLGIYLTENQFNTDKERVENYPNKNAVNTFLRRRMLDVEEIVLKLSTERRLGQMTVTDIKNYVKDYLDGTSQKKILFVDIYAEYMNKIQNYHTKYSYQQTYNKLTSYDKDISKKGFDEINYNYITDFERYMVKNGMSQNTRAIMFKNISAIFTYAKRQEITDYTPFSKFKYKYETTSKRALTIEQLRLFLNCKVDESKRVYLDIFKLSFCLIGINIVDLAALNDIENGRIEYKRAKTGRHYSIKVEPEAFEIISRLRNSEYLVPKISEYKKYDFFQAGYNNALKAIAATVFRDNAKLSEKISHYWVRHTWATIAAGLDIPRDVIAHALGHGNNTVTDIYIDFDQKKVDLANRKVLDYVFYNKL